MGAPAGATHSFYYFTHLLRGLPKYVFATRYEYEFGQQEKANKIHAVVRSRQLSFDMSLGQFPCQRRGGNRGAAWHTSPAFVDGVTRVPNVISTSYFKTTHKTGRERQGRLEQPAAKYAARHRLAHELIPITNDKKCLEDARRFCLTGTKNFEPPPPPPKPAAASKERITLTMTKLCFESSDQHKTHIWARLCSAIVSHG